VKVAALLVTLICPSPTTACRVKIYVKPGWRELTVKLEASAVSFVVPIPFG